MLYSPLLLAIIAKMGHATMNLDRFDGRILLELQRDGRLPVVELAELIGFVGDALRRASRPWRPAASSKAMRPS